MSDSNLEEQLHNQSIADSVKIANAKKAKENPNIKAREIIEEYRMIYYGDSFFKYESGKYHILNDNQMKKIIHDHIRDDYRQSKFKEIQDCMIAQCLVDAINIKSGVNLKNGVFDLDTKTLIPHSPDYRFTTQLNAIYDPEATYPKWNAFLLEMLGDDMDKVMIFQEYAGYCLDYNVNVEMVLFLLGRGANGKSVSCDALKEVIGYGNYDTISLDDLKNKNYIAELLGKLVNISTESQAKAEVYESNLKKLASGEEIKVDRKFKNPFNFKSNCKHIYSLNNLPRVGDKTDAFFRRIIAIPFNAQVVRDKRVLGLGKIIGQEEASGILNWMLEGYYRLKAFGWQFTQSKQVNELLDSYRKDNNNVLTFVDEMCIIGVNQSMSNEESYAKYQTWCKESGVSAVKRKSFVSEIAENFKDDGIIRQKVNGIRGLKGISLNFSNSESY